MKKFSTLIYLLIIAALIIPLSGCGGSSSSDDDQQTQSSQGNLMIVTSRLLKRNSSYKLYRGNKFSLKINGQDFNGKYYAAPISTGNSVTMNLEFAEPLSGDMPFMITEASNDNVVFYYNPNGNGTSDTTTASSNVMRWGGSTNQLSYSGLTIQGSAIDIDTSDAVDIVLDGSTSTATVNGATVPVHNYVWHSDPNHRDEYYTYGVDGSQEYSEDDISSYITNVEGVYINRDIRYLTNNLEFTAQVKNDEETEYAAYYADSVAEEVAAELGSGFEGPYIFATLPAQMGMAGQPGGTPPAHNARAAVSNSDITAFSTMTHSAEEAYENPVLHITASGTYRLSGTWNGQIWVEVGSEELDQVALILDGVNVTCTVAPALVFKEVYECGPTSNVVSFDVAEHMHSENGTNAGAIIVIADGSTNSFTGSNVYRMLKAEKKKDSVTKIDGSDVSQQKKRIKIDGAFYSYQSMLIAAENDNGGGVLNVTSTNYEGMGTEMHLLIDSGTINITAEDDGINVNEDDTSVFAMTGGNLTIVSKNGDGIDSNGWIVITGGTLDITAAQDSDTLDAQAEGPLDSNLGVYMSESAKANYTHRAYSGNSTPTQPTTGDNQDTTQTPTTTTTTREALTLNDSQGNTVMMIRYINPAQDTENSDRNIDSSGNVFTLSHRVNNFSGVK